MNKFKKFVVASTMGLMFASSHSMAAQEINEDEFGPTYETMIADTVVGKPLQFMAAVAGSAAYVVSYPFSYFGGNVEQSKQKLFDEPWQAMDRGLGRTVAEDNYYKSRDFNKNAVRIVVDGPSEILIDTNDEVVINDYAGVVSQ